jgi:hypothetical protein
VVSEFLPAVARDGYHKIAGSNVWIEIGGGHFGLLYFRIRSSSSVSKRGRFPLRLSIVKAQTGLQK